MINRRDTLSHGVRIAALMATAGLLPAAVHAAWSKDAFDAKTLADTVKALAILGQFGFAVLNSNNKSIFIRYQLIKKWRKSYC